MRLIDADNLVPDICDAEIEYGTKPVHFSANAIDLAPTVDAVPVVWCKDCVNGTVFVNKQGAEYVDCVLDDYSVRKPTDYCSYGKRKKGDGNGS